MGTRPPCFSLAALENSRFKEWSHDLALWWRTMPDKAIFGLLLAAWVVLFQYWGNPTLGFIKSSSLFEWTYYVHSSAPDEKIGLLIPWVVLGLLFWKRHELMAVPKSFWPASLILLGLALLLHLVGFLAQQTRISVLAFSLGLYGLTGLVWGPAWLKATFFPMFLLALAVPLTSELEVLTVPLRVGATAVSVGFCHHILDIDVFRKGTQILDGFGTPLYDVAPACSGIRSLLTMGLLMVIYGFVFFQRWWKRAVLISIALPVALAGNILRITIVIIAGEAFGQTTAVAIEQKLGFLTFGLALIAMFLVGRWVGEDDAPGSQPKPSDAGPAGSPASESLTPGI